MSWPRNKEPVENYTSETQVQRTLLFFVKVPTVWDGVIFCNMFHNVDIKYADLPTGVVILSCEWDKSH